MAENSETTMRARRHYSNWFLFGITPLAKMNPIALKLGLNTVGKSSTHDITISSSLCSRKHCILNVTKDQITLTDKSSNGTFVNNVAYKKTRHIISDGDTIGFGASLLNVKKENKYVYVVKFCNENETISLTDDEGDGDIDNVVCNSSDNNSDHVDNFDTDSDADNQEFDFENELFVPFTADDNDNFLIESAIPNNDPKQPSASRCSIPQIIMPNIGIENDIRLNIKEEVSWLSHEYDKKIEDSPLDEPDVIETIDLCDSGSEDTEIDAFLNDINAQITTPTPSTSAAALITSRRRSRYPNDYDYELFEQNQTKRIRYTSESETVPIKSVMPDVEKNRLIEAVKVNPELFKAKVKIARQSRGQRLALDMLGIHDDIGDLSANLASNNISLTTKHEQDHIEKTNSKATESFGNRATSEFDTKLPLTMSRHVNEIITEITGWNIKWLLESLEDPPVNGTDFVPNSMETNFVDLKSYQRTIKSFLKMELWYTILCENVRKSQTKSLFTKLLSFQYVRRGESSSRYVYRCEADINNGSSRHPLALGDFVVVTHSHGRFLAYIATLKVINQANNTIKLKFQMEAAKVLTNKNLSNGTKHISIISIVNIRLELEYFDSLMEMKRSSLCNAVLWPAKYSDLSERLNGQSNETDQERIVQNLYEKCIKSITTKKSAIYLVEGGTGTGKSKTALNLTARLMETLSLQRKRILVCGISNISIDQIAVSLLQHNENIVRFGNLESINKMAQSIAVNGTFLDKNDSMAQSIAVNGTFLDKNDRERVDRADIVLTSICQTSNLCKITKCFFDICIIDEASISTEPMILPLLKLQFKVLVLIGDERMQSANTVNPICRDSGFTRSLFGRIIKSYDDANKSSIYPKLNVQYRMHPEICQWPNKKFYDNKLVSALETFELTKNFPFEPYTVLDFHQDHHEIGLIEEILTVCIGQVNPKKYSYGIISGFAQTKNLLMTKLRENKAFDQIAISSYDCFRGEEKDIIIIAAIKSDPFNLLNSSQMINVAMTRARQSLIFCGNFSGASQLPVWQSFLANANERNRLFTIDYGKFSKSEFLSKIWKTSN